MFIIQINFTIIILYYVKTIYLTIFTHKNLNKIHFPVVHIRHDTEML